ncbi:MAG TPA: DUF2844 domain-containing protein [Terriglobales bacterium]|nr:DUF2844 domain-containing protein [Terriglobales bacterium]
MYSYSQLTKLVRTALGMVLAMAGASLPASAALGGDVASVQKDMVQMRASLKITHAEAYTVHEMQMSYGTVVREFVSPAGQVFGVAWRGPFLPDMRQILGTYFNRYEQVGIAKSRRAQGPLVIQDPELVLESSGHMQSYRGRAYVPTMVPQGVSLDAIR